jgi:hypothetical protein
VSETSGQPGPISGSGNASVGPLPLSASESPPVTARSVAIGSIATVLICSLTPYNDNVLSDNSLTAGFLPLAAVLVQFLLIVLINAPLHRYAPRHALRTPELAIVLLMTSIACSFPSWGLARMFVPTPAVPFYLGRGDGNFWRIFESLGVPAWLFPVTSIEDGRNDPVIRGFYSALGEGESIPWSAWLKPLAGWGVFIAAMLATYAALARLVLDQWRLNERLPFPLVQVQSALIEPPPRGKALNDLLRSRMFWLAALAVIVIHSMNGLNAYAPGRLPQIPLGYDFNRLFADPPLSYLKSDAKMTTASFMVIGVTYFIRSRVAFSLWGIYVAANLVDVYMGVQGREMGSGRWQDQHLGACLAFVLGLAWIGRHHWAMVIANAFGRGSSSAYRLTFWIAVLGITTMIGWLLFMGVTAWVAVLIVAFMLLAHLVVTRVVAETGLPIFRSSVTAAQVYTNLPPSWVSGRDVYFGGVFTVLGSVSARDSAMTLTQQGLGVAREAGHGEDARSWRKLGAVVAWTMLLGASVAIAATLYVHYTHPTPVSRDFKPQGNAFGAIYVHQRDMANPLINHATDRLTPRAHSPALQVAIGFAVTAVLQVLSLRFAAWPLLPVGFVTSYGSFIGNTWFSIFLGWVVKVLVLRFGGASLYTAARPLFVGVIFGEALAAGLWLGINAIAVSMGHEPQSIRFTL